MSHDGSVSGKEGWAPAVVVNCGVRKCHQLRGLPGSPGTILQLPRARSLDFVNWVLCSGSQGSKSWSQLGCVPFWSVGSSSKHTWLLAEFSSLCFKDGVPNSSPHDPSVGTSVPVVLKGGRLSLPSVLRQSLPLLT